MTDATEWRCAIRGLLLLALAAPATAALAQTRDHAPSALPSAQQMRQDRARSESWTYVRPSLDLGAYRNVLIEPTALYGGADAQFEDISPADRRRYAGFMTEALRTELGRSFRIVPRPEPGTLRIRLTLIGMEPTHGGVATATRVTPVGLVANAVRSVAGREGRLTGSMLYAIEIFDAQSGELQAAAVRRKAPDALDIPATLSTSDTARAIARDLSRDIRGRLETAIRRN